VAGGVAPLRAEVLVNGQLAQGEIAANGNMIKLELGSRRKTGCL
jgi:hypothetical protein